MWQVPDSQENGTQAEKKRVESGFCLSKKRTDKTQQFDILSHQWWQSDGGTLQSPKINASALSLSCIRTTINPVRESGVQGHSSPFWNVVIECSVRSGLTMDSSEFAIVSPSSQRLTIKAFFKRINTGKAQRGPVYPFLPLIPKNPYDF